MDNEVWKPFPDPFVKGTHEVSSHGRVRRYCGGILRTNSRSKTGDKRIAIQLRGSRIQTVFAVHRLIAEAFVENPEGKPYVAYKDKDKDNLMSSNLIWVSPSEASRLKREERDKRRTVQELYLILNSQGLHKIGVSVNPIDRANTIRLNSGFDTRVLQSYVTPDAQLLERLLHDHYKDQRMEGEWFKDIDSHEFKCRVNNLLELAPKVREMATVKAAIKNTTCDLNQLKEKLSLEEDTVAGRNVTINNMDGVVHSASDQRFNLKKSRISLSHIYRNNTLRREKEIEVMKGDCTKLRKELIWLREQESLLDL